MGKNNCKAIVIGGSAGSLEILISLFSVLPRKFEIPIVVITHLHPQDNGQLVAFFTRRFPHRIKEATDKEAAASGTIYFPPADYHLLVEQDKTFALSVDPKVNYSRPSIDVFFESAAAAWTCDLVGIILTGASRDGAKGLMAIKNKGGMTLVQDPGTAAYPIMPRAAVDTGAVDKIVAVEEIGIFLRDIARPRYPPGLDHNIGCFL